MNDIKLTHQTEEHLNPMERIQMWGFILAFFAILGLCLFAVYKVANMIPPQPAPIVQEEINFAGISSPINAIWFLGICFVVWVVAKIIRSGFGGIVLMTLMGVAVLVGLFWILLYRGGDVSTPEARDQNLQVVRVVQPIGDPSTDQIYADVNRDNATTNVINAGGVSIYVVLAWVTIVLFAGIGVFFFYLTKK